jgi:hypothetical protein
MTRAGHDVDLNSLAPDDRARFDNSSRGPAYDERIGGNTRPVLCCPMAETDRHGRFYQLEGNGEDTPIIYLTPAQFRAFKNESLARFPSTNP